MHDQIVLIYLDNDPWNMGTPFFSSFLSIFSFPLLCIMSYCFVFFHFLRGSLFPFCICVHIYTHMNSQIKGSGPQRHARKPSDCLSLVRELHSKERERERDGGVYYKLKVAALSYIDCVFASIEYVHYYIPSTAPVLLFI